MLDTLVFLECPAWLKEEIRSYWADKEPRFERLLSTFQPELCHLRFPIPFNKAIEGPSSRIDSGSSGLVLGKSLAAVSLENCTLRCATFARASADTAGVTKNGGAVLREGSRATRTLNCEAATVCVQDGLGLDASPDEIAKDERK
jgi:hypothetical protein